MNKRQKAELASIKKDLDNDDSYYGLPMKIGLAIDYLSRIVDVLTLTEDEEKEVKYDNNTSHYFGKL